MRKGVTAALEGGRQAGRQARRGRLLLLPQSLIHMASVYLNRDPLDSPQELVQRMKYLPKTEREHRAHLVTLMCCMGQY